MNKFPTRSVEHGKSNLRKWALGAVGAVALVASLVHLETAYAAQLKDVTTTGACPAKGESDPKWHLTIGNNRAVALTGRITVIKGGVQLLDEGAYNVPANGTKSIDYPLNDVEDRVVVIKSDGETDDNRIGVDCVQNTTTTSPPETTTTTQATTTTTRPAVTTTTTSAPGTSTSTTVYRVTTTTTIAGISGGPAIIVPVASGPSSGVEHGTISDPGSFAAVPQTAANDAPPVPSLLMRTA